MSLKEEMLPMGYIVAIFAAILLLELPPYLEALLEKPKKSGG